LGIFSASANGVLAYVNGGSVALGLTWLDRTGKRRGNVGDPGILGRFRISPDGKSAAVTGNLGGNQTSCSSPQAFLFSAGIPRRMHGMKSTCATFNNCRLIEPIFSRSRFGHQRCWTR
jgi:hypothetical protein